MGDGSGSGGYLIYGGAGGAGPAGGNGGAGGYGGGGGYNGGGGGGDGRNGGYGGGGGGSFEYGLDDVQISGQFGLAGARFAAAGILGGGDGYVSVDQLGVAAPEPSTWAMMLDGFTGLGAMARRLGRKIRTA